MTPALWFFASVAALAILYAIIAERDARHAERECQLSRTERDYWKGACRRSYGASNLSPAAAERIMREIFAETPGDLLIGTQANPILLPNGDTARYSTLDSLIATREKP